MSIRGCRIHHITQHNEVLLLVTIYLRKPQTNNHVLEDFNVELFLQELTILLHSSFIIGQPGGEKSDNHGQGSVIKCEVMMIYS